GYLPPLARLDLSDAGFFEDAAAFCFHRLGKAEKVLRGIELRLIRDPQCRGGLERQRRFGEHLGVESDTTRGLCFGRYLTAPCRINCIGVSVLRLEVAGDTEFVDPTADLLNTSSVRFGIAVCHADIE